MSPKEFLDKLGITQPGKQEGKSYTVDIVDSDEYSKIYSILDKSDLVDMVESSSLVAQKVNELLFMSDDFDIKLIANFEDDMYKLIITEAED